MAATPVDPAVRTSARAGLPTPRRIGLLRRLTDSFRGFWQDTGSQWIPISRGICDPREFGAFGDGSSHPISGGDVAAIPNYALKGYQAGDEWDYIGIQEAIYAAWGAAASRGGLLVCSNGVAGSYLNGSVYIPGGVYLLNKTLQARNIIGGTLRGAGRFSTMLRNTTADTPILETNMVYSTISGIDFDCGGGFPAGTMGLVEWTWNGDGATTASGLQQLSVYDCLFHGEGRTNTIGFRAARELYQGDNLVFFNCFFAACTEAGFQTPNNASNALSLGFYHCNFQVCSNDGIQINSGSNVDIIACSFQAVPVGAQAGFDIRIISSVNSCSVIHGCRTESIQFLSTDSQHSVDVRGCYGIQAPAAWTAATAYTEGQIVKARANLDGRLYRVLSVTGDAKTGNTEPVWDGTTVMDGNVTWEPWVVYAVSFDSGTLENCGFPYGQVHAGGGTIKNCIFSRTDWLPVDGQGNTILGNQFGVPIDIHGNRVVLEGGINQGDPIAYAPPSLDAGAFPSAKGHTIIAGGSPFLWSRSEGYRTARAVGFWPPAGYRPDGSANDLSQNVLGIIGTIAPRPSLGTDQAGTDLLIQGGLGTGAGAGGRVRIRTAPAGSTGTALNNAVDVLTISDLAVFLDRAFLPGSDPHISGQLWLNGDVLTVSHGA